LEGYKHAKDENESGETEGAQEAEEQQTGCQEGSGRGNRSQARRGDIGEIG
jgi:hypothetical protein